MEYTIILGICVAVLLVLFFVLNINIKKVKELGENKRLNELTKLFPENIEICEWMLKKLKNTTVKVKEDTQSKTSLYIVIDDTITIANIRNSFTRIQTIAHECLHSIQNKRMLWFNFIFTNFYFIYFLVIIGLTIFKIIPNPIIYLIVLLILGMVQYFVRSILETDAMTKARYLAKEYMEENKLCSQDEIQEIATQYDELNKIGIPFVNYDILARNLIKTIIYAGICLLF